MNAPALLDHLRTLGVAVRVAGDKLELEPGSLVPETMVEEIRAVKPEIISLLAQSDTTGGQPPNPNVLLSGALRLIDRFVAGQSWLWVVRETLDASADAGVGSVLERRYVGFLDTLVSIENLLRFTYDYKGCARGPGEHCDLRAVLRCEVCADA